jgi:cobalt-zinc-cadmium efflux system outer membrane protein
VAEESAETALDVLKRIQARFEASSATALDVALAEREYGEARANTARARGELVRAHADLRQVLDLEPHEPVQVAPLPAPSIPAGLTQEASVSRALARRREVASVDNAITRWERADTRMRREAIAPVLVAAEAERQGNTHPNSSLGAGVNWELPMMLRNQGERAVARGQVQALGVTREITEHTIAREAAVAFQRLEAALAELEALEQQASTAADRALAMTSEMLEAGAVDYFRLLAARRSAFELRARRVQSLRDAWLSRIALERAIGGLEGTP